MKTVKKLPFTALALAALLLLTGCAAPSQEASPPPPDETDAEYFPAFTGVDFDGESVDSKTLFTGNKVTVVNFWYSTCGPCLSELAALTALDESLRERGGQVVAINVDTLSGDEKEIAAARSIMADKGASHRNVIPDADSDAHFFAMSVTVFPTSYVVDGEGRIVGEPIVGRIDRKGIDDELSARLDQVLGDG